MNDKYASQSVSRINVPTPLLKIEANNNNSDNSSIKKISTRKKYTRNVEEEIIRLAKYNFIIKNKKKKLIYYNF